MSGTSAQNARNGETGVEPRFNDGASGDAFFAQLDEGLSVLSEWAAALAGIRNPLALFASIPLSFASAKVLGLVRGEFEMTRIQLAQGLGSYLSALSVRQDNPMPPLRPGRREPGASA